jgi:hypothetical protein
MLDPILFCISALYIGNRTFDQKLISDFLFISDISRDSSRYIIKYVSLEVGNRTFGQKLIDFPDNRMLFATDSQWLHFKQVFSERSSGMLLSENGSEQSHAIIIEASML